MEYIERNTKSSDTALSEIKRHIGQTITVHGMIYKIREMSGFAFVLLQMQEGILQCVWSAEASGFSLSVLKENMAVRATGSVIPDERSKIGAELHLTEIAELSTPKETAPIVINGKSVNAAIETLLDYRPLTLRNAKERAIFRLQAEICRGLRRFLEENGFTEIHSPKIVSGSAEGGANVFKLDYFGKEAFLAQSPQFYKQSMIGVFERVYEIAPVFRAEKHDTARHINEYTSVDIEMAFVETVSALMKTETAMLESVFDHLKHNCEAEIALLGAKIPEIKKIPVIPFREAKAMLSRFPAIFTDDADFSPAEEKQLSELIQKETGSEMVFVTHYLTEKRPFYAKERENDPSVTESFDLLFRGMEITTGGLRIHSYDEQIRKMEARGMNIALFESYLMAHRYGLPPHGGMGIGLERLTAKLLGFENVRRATLFPRDTHRLTP